MASNKDCFFNSINSVPIRLTSDLLQESIASAFLLSGVTSENMKFLQTLLSIVCLKSVLKRKNNCE